MDDKKDRLVHVSIAIAEFFESLAKRQKKKKAKPKVKKEKEPRLWD